MLANRPRALILAVAGLLTGVACDAGDEAARLRVTDVEISNAVAVVRKPNGKLVERKDPNIQTIYFDIDATGVGAWTSQCTYELRTATGDVVDEGVFELSGGEGNATNLAAPFTFDVRELEGPPEEARVECPLTN